MKQYVIITGASQGIGKAIATYFAEQGAEIFITARNENNLQALSTQLAPRKVHYWATDLSEKKNVLALSEEVKTRMPQVNVLINNAGIYIPGQVQEDHGEMEKMMAINFYAAFHLTCSLLPHLIQNQPAHIFNMCSIAGLQAYANGGAYGVSKFALRGFNDNLREEMKTKRVKVTAVYPGATLSPSWEGSDVEENRIMKAHDIAQMIYAATQLSAQAVVENIVMRPMLGDL